MKPHYFFKKYVFRYLEIWGILCALFLQFFLLAQVDFGSPELRNKFILSFWVWVGLMSVVLLARNGVLTMIGINGFQDRDADVLNTFIDINGHVVKDISDEDLKTLFYYLKKENIIGAIKGTIYSYVGAIIPLALTMYFFHSPMESVLAILIIGVFGGVLLSSFILFFSEGFFANTLKECREAMKSRGLETDEKIYSTSLKGKFSYFVFLSFLLIIVTLSFVAKITFFLLIIILIAFILITIISRLLFSSIYLVFEEIRDFVKRLSAGEKVEYFPGTSCREELDLSRDLNKNAEELYKRGEEINKWYKLTVGRELKMIELKDRNKELGVKIDDLEKKIKELGGKK